MNNATLAKNFVKYNTQGIHKHGKASNFFFEGNRLYSYGYHWIVAEYDAKRDLFFLNNSSYSPTTQRQTMHARQAMPENTLIGEFLPRDITSKASIENAMKVAMGNVQTYKNKLKKARTPHTEAFYAEQVSNYRQQYKTLKTAL